MSEISGVEFCEVERLQNLDAADLAKLKNILVIQAEGKPLAALVPYDRYAAMAMLSELIEPDGGVQ